MESYLKEAVLGVVTLAAAGADHVTTPGGSLAIVILGHSERGAATAGDQEHAKGARGLAAIR